jgi:hypothetical protein
MGDLNCKHPAWNNFAANKNDNTLFYCGNKSISINFPYQPTHYPYNSYPSVLDIALTQRCTTYKSLAVPFLSSDHNPILFKVFIHGVHPLREDPIIDTPTGPYSEAF